MWKSDAERIEVLQILCRRCPPDLGEWKTLENDAKKSLWFERTDAYRGTIKMVETLLKHKILLGKTFWAGEEVDGAIITGAQVEILRRLDNENWPTDETEMEARLKQWGFTKNHSSCQQKVEEEEEAGPVILGDECVSRERWNEYWRKKGQPEGPKSGWEIPTPKQLNDFLM